MYAKQRPLGGRHPVVQDMPGAPHSVLVDHGDRTRPSWIQARHRAEFDAWDWSDVQRVGHQTTSAYEVLRPEPMPMRRMRSSACSRSICRARVKGTAAGPMLP